MKVYRKVMGDESAEPIAIAGGTYARATKNIVAFGPTFLDDEDVIHQKDERISLEHYYQLIEIFGKAMILLADE